MSWQTCVLACVSVVSLCGMVCFVAWCGFKAVSGIGECGGDCSDDDDEGRDDEKA